MSAAERIATALGGAYRSGNWWRCRCPAHHGSGATLAIKDGERGLVVHCHAGCPREAVMAEMARLDSDSDSDEEQPAADHAAEVADLRRRKSNALYLWDESHPATATTQVPTYLASRGIWGPIPQTVRVHGMMWHRESGEKRPAMIGLIEHVESGPVGVHLTFLAIDGSCKATIDPVRKAIGFVKGGAVRLGCVLSDDWLIVGEGLETTFSAMWIFGHPGWAALSSSGLRNLILPPDVRRILIAADNDENGIGQSAAVAAASMWREEGRTVRVELPPLPGTDFNDIILMERI